MPQHAQKEVKHDQSHSCERRKYNVDNDDDDDDWAFDEINKIGSHLSE